jgi:hypothetical protein
MRPPGAHPRWAPATPRGRRRSSHSNSTIANSGARQDFRPAAAPQSILYRVDGITRLRNSPHRIKSMIFFSSTSSLLAPFFDVNKIRFTILLIKTLLTPSVLVSIPDSTTAHPGRERKEFHHDDAL